MSVYELVKPTMVHPRDFFDSVPHAKGRNRVACRACGQEYFYHSRKARQHLIKCAKFTDEDAKREMKKHLDLLARELKRKKTDGSDTSDSEVIAR